MTTHGCVFEGCLEDAVENKDLFASTRIEGVEIRVHLCVAHLEWLRVGSIMGLTLRGTEAKPASEDSDAE